MERRVSRRGWIVLDSVASHDGNFCVDIFESQDATFGFEHFRSDPEDGGRWTPVGGFAARRFTALSEVLATAEETISWLKHSTGWAPMKSELTANRE